MSDDDKKKLLNLTVVDKPRVKKPKKPKKIPSRVSFAQSFVGKENLHQREAWSQICVARKQSTELHELLNDLRINSGGDLISHYYDLKMEPFLLDDSVAGLKSDKLKALLQPLIPSLPVAYGSFLRSFMDTSTWTSPRLWTVEWQEENFC